MFGSAKRLRKEVEEKLEHLLERYDLKIREVREDMEVFKKLANLREYKKIEQPSFIHFLGNGRSAQEEWDKARETARKEGFDFAHKYTNGDEIWVKYVEGQ